MRHPQYEFQISGIKSGICEWTAHKYSFESIAIGFHMHCTVKRFFKFDTFSIIFAWCTLKIWTRNLANLKWSEIYQLGVGSMGNPMAVLSKLYNEPFTHKFHFWCRRIEIHIESAPYPFKLIPNIISSHVS